jgi:hypothetical protein
MHFPLEEWAANILDMNHHTATGPDLYFDQDGEKCCIETKWSLVPTVKVESNYPECWTVDEDQLAYPKTWGKGYWGFGVYSLDRAVEDIDFEDKDSLDDFVTHRELWLVRWNWINMYPPSITASGPTYRYPKLKDIPNTQHTHESTNGKIHVTSYVPDKYFFPSQDVDCVPF